MPDDAGLLREFARERSPEVFGRLVERHLGAVHGAARRILGAELGQHAEDVAQSVFILLAREAGKIPEGTPLVGWLYRVTHYACANVRKMERRRRMREAAAMRSEICVPSTLSDAEALLDPALLTLSAKDRDALLLRYMQDMSVAEIARVTRVPEETAKKRLQRGLGKLRKYFAGQGMLSAAPVALRALEAGRSAAVRAMAPAITARALAPISGAAGGAIGVLIAQEVAHMMQIVRLTKIVGAVAAVLATIFVFSAVIIREVAPSPTGVSASASVAASATAPAAGNVIVGPEALVTWRDLVKQATAMRNSYTSLQLHIEGITRIGSGDNPVLIHNYSWDFKQQEAKYYSNIHITGFDPPQPGTSTQPVYGESEREMAFDGTLLRTHTVINTNGRKVDQIAQTRKIETAKLENVLLGQPFPWTSLDDLSPTEDELASGRFALASVQNVQENDARLWVITFNYEASGHVLYRIVYDASRGLLPIKGQAFAEGGAVSTDIRGVTIQEVHAGDKTFYFPTAGIVERFNTGQSVGYSEFHIDPKTLVVNADIQEETFHINPKTEDLLYDSDLGTVIKDRGQ